MIILNKIFLEAFKNLKLLLQKNCVMRKRQWKTNFVGEILIPLSLILCLWLAKNISGNLKTHAPVTVDSDSIYEIVTKRAIVESSLGSDNLTIYFSPDNAFTRELLRDMVSDCLNLDSSDTILKGYKNELELVKSYEENETGYSRKVVAVVFVDENISESTKQFRYKIRARHLSKNELFNVMTLDNLTAYYTEKNTFALVQICLDDSFIKTKINDTTFHHEISIQRMPYPPYIKQIWPGKAFRDILNILLLVIFMFPLFIETSQTSNEKFCGINVLLSLNGVSNSLNLFGCLLSGLMFVGTLLVIPIMIFLLTSIGDSFPYIYHSNSFLVWLMLMLYNAHLLTTGIHFSAYFSRSQFVILALLITSIIPISLQLHGLKNNPIIPYLGVLFPNLLLFRAFEEINYYELIGEGISWNNLFIVGNKHYEVGGSLGMLLALSFIGIIVHFTLANYAYLLNPGDYGFKRKTLFFLKKKNNNTQTKMGCVDNDDSDSNSINFNNSSIYNPIIRTKNLKKEFDVGIFCKDKVKALQGISIDFHEGQITALLGRRGAGKTTMVSIITGLIDDYDGIVQFNNQIIQEPSADIGVCMQKNVFFPDLTVIENLEFFAKLKSKVDEEKIDEYVTELLLKFKLLDKKDSLSKKLIEDEQRRLSLCLALAKNPKILILDEPTFGLDLEGRMRIWDILLKVRSSRTVVVSTYDIEEADVLADKIAILHTGQLRSYGTVSSLKRLLGDSILEITLHVSMFFDIEKLHSILPNEGKILSMNERKVVLHIPDSIELATFLDKIEEQKVELGVTNFTVSQLSLEQVFLNTIQVHEDLERLRQPIRINEQRESGKLLLAQRVRALLCKKFIYTRKNLLVIIFMFLMVPKALLSVSFALNETDVSRPSNELIHISLGMYPEAEVYYKSNNKDVGRNYKFLTDAYDCKATEVVDANLNKALLNAAAAQNFYHYDNHILAAADIRNEGKSFDTTAMYSEKSTHSLPISINLISNSMIKGLKGEDYSIDAFGQQLSTFDDFDYDDSTKTKALTVAIMFSFLSFSAITLFSMHPSIESMSKIKRLQTMTGVSGFVYWGTMFVFDFLVYMVLTIFLLTSLVVIDSVLNLDIYGAKELFFLLFLFALLAANLLPLVYILSFLNTPTENLFRLLNYLPLGTISLELLMGVIHYSLNSYPAIEFIRTFQKGIFLLTPYISFLHSQMSFYRTVLVNSRCENMPNAFYKTECTGTNPDTCCAFECHSGACKNPASFFTNFSKDVTMEEALIYLCLTPFLYFGLLFVIEYELVPTFMAKISRYDNVSKEKVDESVKLEKSMVSKDILTLNEYNEKRNVKNNEINALSSNQITLQEYSSNLNVAKEKAFLAYALNKRYGDKIAVEDVSFEVKKTDCFGILGSNNVGKSTLLDIITGGKAKDKGILYLEDKDFEYNKRKFLSQIGYCPQNDITIQTLNGYDHLELFARLRGIPEEDVQAEVTMWVNRMNLKVCASQPCSSYSISNKRRLNIAMALIGTPKLIVLDEPTLGADPCVKRFIWKVIKSVQATGRTVILASSSMDECESLCNKLAVMVSGRFVCIGSPDELKLRFNVGHNIQIKLNPKKSKNQVASLKNDMEKALDCHLVDENSVYLTYYVMTNTTWRKMFGVKEEMLRKYSSINTFSILTMTLEQLFLIFNESFNNPTNI